MRNIYVFLGFMSVLVGGSAIAYDGTINFIGKVVDQTCSVDTASKNLTVTLPTVSKSTLNTDAATAGLTPFSLRLTGCATDKEGAKKVKAYFEPSGNIDITTHNLKNTDASGTKADNVQIQLLNSDGTTKIQLGENSATQGVQPVSITGTNVDIPYYAQYYATGAATPGDVKAAINYTIAYE